MQSKNLIRLRKNKRKYSRVEGKTHIFTQNLISHLPVDWTLETRYFFRFKEMINISWPLLDLLSGCCSRCTTSLMADHGKTGSHHRAIAWGVYTTAARSPDTGNGGQRGSHSKFKNIAEFSGWLARSDQYLFLCSELPGFATNLHYGLWTMDIGHTATMGTKQYFSFS